MGLGGLVMGLGGLVVGLWSDVLCENMASCSGAMVIVCNVLSSLGTSVTNSRNRRKKLRERRCPSMQRLLSCDLVSSSSLHRASSSSSVPVNDGARVESPDDCDTDRFAFASIFFFSKASFISRTLSLRSSKVWLRVFMVCLWCKPTSRANALKVESFNCGENLLTPLVLTVDGFKWSTTDVISSFGVEVAVGNFAAAPAAQMLFSPLTR